MSGKHYFPSTAANTLVPRALRALVSANSHLVLDEGERAVADGFHDNAKVAIIGGGGSGHEPAWSGYVGEGLLSAAACGDIFASPSTKQILAAMRMVPSSKGVIFLITNYTGDRLHFGLAAEKAKAEGLADNIVILAATDDVSIGKSKNSRLGRRGMAGHVFTMKILGAAAASGLSFTECVNIGSAVNDHIVTIGSALDHCHVPGRQHQYLADDTCVIGAGIHNEPGQQTINPVPLVEDLVSRCLGLLLDQSDSERAFVQFGPDDQVGLLVNNYGGLSTLELGALAHETQKQLASRWNIEPCKTYIGTFEASLNAPGFSISLCNLSAAAKKCNSSVDALLSMFNQPTTAVSWPNTYRPPPGVGVPNFRAHKEAVTDQSTKAGHVYADAASLKRAVKMACEAAIAAEPYLTEWDMIMGDGDCGEAVKGLADSVLQNIQTCPPQNGDVLSLLRDVIKCVDDMGGTLGAIFGILLSSFSTSLKRIAFEGKLGQNSLEFYANALSSAVLSLKSHTGAREGDRTVMDVLLPFEKEFTESKSLGSAVEVAGRMAEQTRYLKPKFGRATYVGEAPNQELPDPGAWALYEILRGLSRGLET
ncbi:unnamed protein product [Clonostachys byssicola]|uniref:Dihydroxyacetone kinase n=1 Tax=Clonostachys byssicola TaxID=160290 RepID=A0A9N9UGQ1_9HYPO|nr:unnamed protein product [Clonostachys byssicola]